MSAPIASMVLNRISGTAGPPAVGAGGRSSLGARIVDTTERADQIIVLHRQLADFGMQFLDTRTADGLTISRRHEQIRSVQRSASNKAEFSLKRLSFFPKTGSRLRLLSESAEILKIISLV